MRRSDVQMVLPFALLPLITRTCKFSQMLKALLVAVFLHIRDVILSRFRDTFLADMMTLTDFTRHRSRHGAYKKQ